MLLEYLLHRFCGEMLGTEGVREKECLQTFQNRDPVVSAVIFQVAGNVVSLRFSSCLTLYPSPGGISQDKCFEKLCAGPVVLSCGPTSSVGVAFRW